MQCVLFFLSSYVDHRDLYVRTHAVPTRRSSDLSSSLDSCSPPAPAPLNQVSASGTTHSAKLGTPLVANRAPTSPGALPPVPDRTAGRLPTLTGVTSPAATSIGRAEPAPEVRAMISPASVDSVRPPTTSPEPMFCSAGQLSDWEVSGR